MIKKEGVKKRGLQKEFLPKRVNLFFFFIIVVPIIAFLVEAQSTQLVESGVPNEPPNLTGIIPNQTWNTGTNNSNAFDLNDYFFDPNHNDVLVFNVTGNTNINVVIDPITNIVSFNQPAAFEGSEVVVFTASDGEFNTSSNNVLLNVTSDIVDKEAPQWFNPAKNSSIVDTGETVLFTAQWTDNLSLDAYILGINQGGGWINQTHQDFSGKSNTSSQEVLITASGGTVVFWYFFANDTSGNFNQTDVLNFTVLFSNASGAPSGSSSSSSSIAQELDEEFEELDRPLGVAVPPPPEEEEVSIREFFFVSDNLIRASVKQGQSETKFLKLTNGGDTTLQINYTINGDVSGFIRLFEESFILEPGKEALVAIDFSATEESIPDLYTGDIEFFAFNLAGDRLSVKTDILLEVNQVELSFGVNVSVHEEHKRVTAGSNISASIQVMALKDRGEVEGEIYYDIRDLKSNILDSKQDPLVITDGVILEKSLILPDDAKEGSYVFFARLIYEDEASIGHDIFEVVTFFKKIGDWLWYIFWAIIIILLLFIFPKIKTAVGLSNRRLRLMNLYYLITAAKRAIEAQDMEEATRLLRRIKKYYGEKVRKSQFQDKEYVVSEIERLHESIFEDEQANIPSLKEAAEKEDEKVGQKKIEEGHEEVKEETEEETKEEKTQEKPVEKKQEEEKPAEAEKPVEKKEAEKEEKPKEGPKEEDSPLKEVKEDLKKVAKEEDKDAKKG